MFCPSGYVNRHNTKINAYSSKMLRKKNHQSSYIQNLIYYFAESRKSQIIIHYKKYSAHRRTPYSPQHRQHRILRQGSAVVQSNQSRKYWIFCSLRAPSILHQKTSVRGRPQESTSCYKQRFAAENGEFSKEEKKPHFFLPTGLCIHPITIFETVRRSFQS